MDSNYVEMQDLEHDDDDLVSKSSLYNLHQQQLHQDLTNDINRDQIILALGGIDNILSHYLDPQNNIKLSQIQLNTINNIINKKQSAVPDSSIFSFNKSNTILHQIFHSLTAQRISHIIQHKITLTIFVIWMLVLFFWLFTIEFLDIVLKTNPNFHFFFIYLLISCIIFIIYAVLYILTANIKAIKLSMRSFLFWLKTFSSLQFLTTWFMLYWYLPIFVPHNGVTKSMFILVQSCCGVVLLLLVLGLCIIDSLYMSRRIKILWNIFLCIVWTALTLRHIFYPLKNDRSIIEIGNHLSISLLSLNGDALKVLAIFFWKQAIYLIVNPNKCVNIRQSTYFKWE